MGESTYEFTQLGAKVTKEYLYLQHRKNLKGEDNRCGVGEWGGDGGLYVNEAYI